MNIYFDIDGVLLGTKSPKKDVIKLLRYCLCKYPNSTYWLTTHCKSGENKTDFVLRDEFPDSLVEQIYNTFLPFESERNILEKYLVLDSFFRMNPKDPKMAKKALHFLKKQR